MFSRLNSLFPVPRYAAQCRDENSRNREIADKSVLVVGGTHGIGLAIARRFAELGAIVHVAARNAERGKKVSESLGGSSRFFEVDLATIRGMHKFCDDVTRDLPKLDYLVMTAGGLPRGTLELTTDNIERGFAVQCLARFCVARRLAPIVNRGILIVAAPSSSANARLDLNDVELRGEQYRRRIRPLRVYAQMERDTLFLDSIAMRLSERYPHLNVTHIFPGLMNTVDSTRTDYPSLIRSAGQIFGPVIMNDAKTWADIPIHVLAGTTPGLHLVNSLAKPMNTSLWVLDARNREAVWQYSDNKVGILE